MHETFEEFSRPLHTSYFRETEYTSDTSYTSRRWYIRKWKGDSVPVSEQRFIIKKVKLCADNGYVDQNGKTQPCTNFYRILQHGLERKWNDTGNVFIWEKDIYYNGGMRQLKPVLCGITSQTIKKADLLNCYEVTVEHPEKELWDNVFKNASVQNFSIYVYCGSNFPKNLGRQKGFVSNKYDNKITPEIKLLLEKASPGDNRRITAFLEDNGFKQNTEFIYTVE